ncbi:MAG TPA: hypothetical protein DD401_04230 [Prevotella sp.]|nr:hypothetical protein [Prevotella sp.]
MSFFVSQAISLDQDLAGRAIAVTDDVQSGLRLGETPAVGRVDGLDSGCALGVGVISLNLQFLVDSINYHHNDIYRTHL